MSEGGLPSAFLGRVPFNGFAMTGLLGLSSHQPNHTEAFSATRPSIAGHVAQRARRQQAPSLGMWPGHGDDPSSGVNSTRLRLHGLRHTSATLALEEGIDIHVVSDRLDHSSTHITSQIYSHVARPMQSDAADRVAARIFQRGL